MGEKFKKFIQEQSNKEADEIMELVNQDPEMADVHAPDEMGEALFARIAEYEQSKKDRKLSEEEKELIELGKVYKKRRKVRKYVAVALIAILAMSFGGITVMGGPEKVLEVVEKWIAGGKETRINSKDARIEEVMEYTEEEAYEKIREEFGFDPVYMDYMPEGMEFVEYGFYKDTQYINFIYYGENNVALVCIMRPNYRIGSTGHDVEEIILEKYNLAVSETIIRVTHCQVKENGEERWYIEFEYENVYYFYQALNVNKENIDLIIDGLYFP